jgi:hypothetical protein
MKKLNVRIKHPDSFLYIKVSREFAAWKIKIAKKNSSVIKTCAGFRFPNANEVMIYSSL